MKQEPKRFQIKVCRAALIIGLCLVIGSSPIGAQTGPTGSAVSVNGKVASFKGDDVVIETNSGSVAVKLGNEGPHRSVLSRFLACLEERIVIALEQIEELVPTFRRGDQQKRRELLRQKIESENRRDALELTHPAAPARAHVLLDQEKARDSAVFIRGEADNRGPVVPRRFLECLSGPDRKPFTQGSGRLELARAIASPQNPLTARVLANRIWQHHFGAGLVTTPSDFGTRAEPLPEGLAGSLVYVSDREGGDALYLRDLARGRELREDGPAEAPGERARQEHGRDSRERGHDVVATAGNPPETVVAAIRRAKGYVLARVARFSAVSRTADLAFRLQ